MDNPFSVGGPTPPPWGSRDLTPPLAFVPRPFGLKLLLYDCSCYSMLFYVYLCVLLSLDSLDSCHSADHSCWHGGVSGAAVAESGILTSSEAIGRFELLSG